MCDGPDSGESARQGSEDDAIYDDEWPEIPEDDGLSIMYKDVGDDGEEDGDESDDQESPRED